jgi:hypothetical protein
MKRGILIFAFLLWRVADAQSTDGWLLFGKVTFNSKFIKEYKEHFLVPAFDSKIRALEGTEITLRGHYLPFDLDDNSIILSKYPYAACFFCGGAGPESIAEVFFSKKQSKFKADQILTVKGKLRLNDTNVNHMNFILEEAEIINR